MTSILHHSGGILAAADDPRIRIKDKTLLFAGRNMAKVRWYGKKQIYTASCGAENACPPPARFAPETACMQILDPGFDVPWHIRIERWS